MSSKSRTTGGYILIIFGVIALLVQVGLSLVGEKIQWAGIGSSLPIITFGIIILSNAKAANKK